MKRLEFKIKFVVVLLLAAGLIAGFLSNEKHSSFIIDADEDVMEVKIAIGTDGLKE